MRHLHVYVADGRQHPTCRWAPFVETSHRNEAPVRGPTRARTTREGLTHRLQACGAPAQGTVPRQANVCSNSIVASRRGPLAWRNAMPERHLDGPITEGVDA
jgi:hypothetical protein